MLKSMTGFGRCYLENPSLSQQWEIKSVNARYLDLKWRLPAFARYLEPTLEKVVKLHAARGRVEISLALRFSSDCAPKPAFDANQAAAMMQAIKDLAIARADQFTPDYNRFLAIPALWTEPELEDIDDMAGMLESGLKLALEDWNESRETEGDRLGVDLENRITLMNEWLGVIEAAAPAVKEEKIQQLRERLTLALAGVEYELDEDRFLQEIVILADRLDVSEEITRLAVHLSRLKQLLRDGGEIGRKLDFTLQECFREINTCGNKLQDAELSRTVVDFKNELEKCREQAQNLE